MQAKETIKVALLSFSLEEYSVRLANALSQATDVYLFLPEQEAASFLEGLSPSVNFYPFRGPRLRQAVQQIVLARRLLHDIRRLNPDVIHFQQGHFWFNLALPFLKPYPIVLTIHDPRYHLGDRESQKTPQAIMDFGYRRATQIIVHGQQVKQVLVEQLRISSERIYVVPHVILGGDSATSGEREEAHTVLFFGRIWEYKGLEYLIRAEPLITERVPDAKIVIAGEGEDFSRYREMMAHPDRFVVFNEYIPNDRRDILFRRASVVALPYLDASQSGVIPIAYAFAKPVIATAVGSLPEAVENGKTGYLVPPRNVKALADAIVRLLQDNRLRHAMGVNAKRRLEQEASPEKVAEQTLTVYRHAIENVRTSHNRPRHSNVLYHGTKGVDRAE